MSTIIYNRNGGIEINPDPFLKVQFRKVVGSLESYQNSIRGYGKSMSVPSIRYSKCENSIIDLPDFDELSDFMNDKSQEEVEFFQYNITNNTVPHYPESRVNGIYLSFNILKDGGTVNRKSEILDFLGINEDLIKEAENLCEFFKSPEVVIGRNYDIYFLRRVHTSNKISSGWLFNGIPEERIFTSVNISSMNWMDNLDEILEGIYFDLSEIVASSNLVKVSIPVILNPKGISVNSPSLDFYMSRINGSDKDKILGFLDSRVERKLENRIPINLSEIYIRCSMTFLKTIPL